MIIECTVDKTYKIDDYILKEYAEFVLTNGIEPDFYSFIEWLSDDAYDLEDMQEDTYCEWTSINGEYDIDTEFKNIIENYYND